MRRRLPSIILILSCSLILVSCKTAGPPATRDPGIARAPRPTVTPAVIEKRIHALVNRERQQQGLAPLVFDSALAGIARSHSRDMAEREYFSHLSPDGDDFFDRYRQAHYVCSVQVGSVVYFGGENIALNNLYASEITVNGIVYYDWNTEDEIARTTVQGWMESAGHRRNILTPHWGKEGIGVHIAPDDRVYITQNFC